MNKEKKELTPEEILKQNQPTVIGHDYDEEYFDDLSFVSINTKTDPPIFEIKQRDKDGNDVSVALGETIVGNIVSMTKELTEFPPYNPESTEKSEPLLATSGVTYGEDYCKDRVSGKIKTYNEWKTEKPNAKTTYKLLVMTPKEDSGELIKYSIPVRGYSLVTKDNPGNLFDYLSSHDETAVSLSKTRFSLQGSEYNGNKFYYVILSKDGDTTDEEYKKVLADESESELKKRGKRFAALKREKEAEDLKDEISATPSTPNYPEGTINPNDIPF